MVIQFCIHVGHAKAVRDIDFNRDGTQFLSCSYDRYIKLWDTETGKTENKLDYETIVYVS